MFIKDCSSIAQHPAVSNQRNVKHFLMDAIKKKVLDRFKFTM